MAQYGPLNPSILHTLWLIQSLQGFIFISILFARAVFPINGTNGSYWRICIGG